MTNTNAELCYTLSILHGDGELTEANIASEVAEYSPQPSAEQVALLVELAQDSAWIEEDGETVEETFASISK